jgi:hypothetical protein
VAFIGDFLHDGQCKRSSKAYATSTWLSFSQARFAEPRALMVAAIKLAAETHISPSPPLQFRGRPAVVTVQPMVAMPRCSPAARSGRAGALPACRLGVVV